MPQRARTSCKTKHCINLTTPGFSYCVQCSKDYRAERDAERMKCPRERQLREFYASSLWTKLSLAFRAENPLCFMCSQLGTEVDHIIPIRYGGAPLDWANLQTLCRRCHKLKTHQDKKKYRDRVADISRLVGIGSSFDGGDHG